LKKIDMILTWLWQCHSRSNSGIRK